MTWLLGFASILMASYLMLSATPSENEVVWNICRIVILIVANALLMIASDCYDKLKSRIKTLEDKVENNADNIHKLSKKQSDKSIEYSIDKKG